MQISFRHLEKGEWKRERLTGVKAFGLSNTDQQTLMIEFKSGLKAFYTPVTALAGRSEKSD